MQKTQKLDDLIENIYKNNSGYRIKENDVDNNICFIYCSSNALYLKGDIKDFKNKNNTRRLSFASEQDLMNIMKLIAGSVTPLGLLNDKELKVIFYLDKDFLNDKQIIGVHPNDNTATLWLKVEDLIDIIKEHGNQVDVVEL